MLKVSRRLNYGLQLMLALASEVDGGSKSTALIAEKLNIPLPFLHQIAHTLQQNGLIKATPGPRGGLRLGQKGKISPSMTFLMRSKVNFPCQQSNQTKSVAKMTSHSSSGKKLETRSATS